MRTDEEINEQVSAQLAKMQAAQLQKLAALEQVKAAEETIKECLGILTGLRFAQAPTVKQED